MDMRMSLHKLAFPCPSCGREATILEINACADGEISIEALCATCGKQMTFKTDIQKILTTCVQADILYPMELDLSEANDETQ